MTYGKKIDRVHKVCTNPRILTMLTLFGLNQVPSFLDHVRCNYDITFDPLHMTWTKPWTHTMSHGACGGKAAPLAAAPGCARAATGAGVAHAMAERRSAVGAARATAAIVA